MTEVILRRNGLNVVYIPYGGGAAYLQALVGGSDIHMGFMTQATAIGLADRFRVLAVTGSRRNPHLPDIPTLGELGLPSMPGISFSLNVRSGTPSAAIQRVFAATSQVLRQAEVRTLLEKNNFSVLNQDTQSAAKSLAEYAAFFGEVARQVGIQPE
jgi:tripartite-type tricarboxylate transporter receptor subunit TctC